MPSAQTTAAQPTTGLFNYLDHDVEHSLYRNGKVLTRRDRDGSDAGTEGVDLSEHELTVEDARQLSCSVESSGFELLARPLGDPSLDFFQHDEVVRTYYGECAALVREAAGAAHAYAFDHNIRSAIGKQGQRRIEGGQQVQGPAHVVHGDYTLTSAPQRLRDLASPPTANDTLRSVLAEGESLVPRELAEQALDGGRFAIINVWRNITERPVATHPLALCDAQSVQPEDLAVFEIHYHDRIGENYFAKHSARHRWFYYPAMTRDEALLIKQWDSAGPLARSGGGQGDASDPDAPCTFSFHSAFADPATPDDAPERWSIEVRCIAML